MKILISGAGIAGPALAHWLLKYGHEPSIVEHAPRFRTGGYVIDFWGRGYDIVEKMGLIPEIRERGYFVKEVRFVDRDGERTGGFCTDVFGRATRDRFVSLRRGDLAAAIYGSIDGEVETIFGDSIDSLTDDGEDVLVTLSGGNERRFDLVFGADGLHSNVRSLVFGPQDRFEHYLGYKVAAFEIAGYRPREEDVYMLYTEVGRQVARFSMRDDRTTILFVHIDEDPATPDDLAGQKAALHKVFDGDGWECAPILAALDAADELYFDRVSQIRMGAWTSGRVALLGDAAFCASLLAGEGSALAIIAAYVLAGELDRAGGDHVAAFAAYERLMRPFIAEKQKAARGFAGVFAPRSRLALFLRNQITKAFHLPFVASLALGSGLQDNIDLPNYRDEKPTAVR
jgi:2-polyprenyl-6-methoxyphenol hydroxylase-like FAD-dependent oxidoreductase